MAKPRWTCRTDRTGKICRDVKQKDPNVAVGLTGIGEVHLKGYKCKPVGRGYVCFVKKRRKS